MALENLETALEITKVEREISETAKLPDQAGTLKETSRLPEQAGTPTEQIESLKETNHLSEQVKIVGNTAETLECSEAKETGWSDEIIDHIENIEQYRVYKEAGLHEGEVLGRKCLLKDIDMDYIDLKTGMTNRERMERGLSPIDAKTGEKIELHHMGQNFDSPFAELCENSEHGDGKHSILHTSTGESWRNNPEMDREYKNQKRHHWQTRAQEG